MPAAVIIISFTQKDDVDSNFLSMILSWQLYRLNNLLSLVTLSRSRIGTVPLIAVNQLCFSHVVSRQVRYLLSDADVEVHIQLESISVAVKEEDV